jgi:hypothetical protein
MNHKVEIQAAIPSFSYKPKLDRVSKPSELQARIANDRSLLREKHIPNIVTFIVYTLYSHGYIMDWKEKNLR